MTHQLLINISIRTYTNWSFSCWSYCMEGTIKALLFVFKFRLSVKCIQFKIYVLLDVPLWFVVDIRLKYTSCLNYAFYRFLTCSFEIFKVQLNLYILRIVSRFGLLRILGFRTLINYV